MGKKIHFIIFLLRVENFSTFMHDVSSKPKQTIKASKGKVGRPATGRKTRTIRASVPIIIDDEVKKTAFNTGESYSGFITRAIQMALLQYQQKA